MSSLSDADSTQEHKQESLPKGTAAFQAGPRESVRTFRCLPPGPACPERAKRVEGLRDRSLPVGDNIREITHADKAALYLLVKQINRAGRAAHVDDPESAAAYNLSILHRRAAPRKAKELAASPG